MTLQSAIAQVSSAIILVVLLPLWCPPSSAQTVQPVEEVQVPELAAQRDQ